MTISKPERELSPETELVRTLVLDFYSFQSSEKINFCLRHPVNGILLQQPEPANADWYQHPWKVQAWLCSVGYSLKRRGCDGSEFQGVTRMTESLNNRGQGVAFYHLKQGGCSVITIVKRSAATRCRSHLCRAMKIKGLVTLVKILGVQCLEACQNIPSEVKSKLLFCPYSNNK